MNPVCANNDYSDYKRRCLSNKYILVTNNYGLFIESRNGELKLDLVSMELKTVFPSFNCFKNMCRFSKALIKY